MFTRSSRLRAAAFIGASFGAVAAAQAGFTAINAPVLGASHEQILENLYGGDFVGAGLDFSNGTVTAVRIDDDLDQVWSDAIVVAGAQARFAAFEQAVGYSLGADGGAFQSLFNVGGSGFNVSGSSSTVDLSGTDFRWKLLGENGSFSSKDSENVDGLDHLVTYRIDGLNDGATTWLLFWEDLNLDGADNVDGSPSDRDFNDLVVEIKTVPIPLPMAAVSGLGMLGALGVARKLRRRTA